MTGALLGHHAEASSNGAGFTTAQVDTTGADLIAVTITDYDAGSTFTDSKTNTWVSAYTADTIRQPTSRTFFAKNALGGTAHTFAVAGSSEFMAVYISWWSGSDLTAPLDKFATHFADFASTAQAGSVTPAANGEILIACCTHQDFSGSTPTIDSGFTILDTIVGVGSQHFGGGAAYLIQATAAAVNPTWSAPSLTNAGIVTFKTASGGGSTSKSGADSETLVGTESASLAATLGGSDASTPVGTESPTVTGTFTKADAGAIASADAASLTAAMTVADADTIGSADATSLAVGVTAADASTATGADSASLSAQTTAADTGAIGSSDGASLSGNTPISAPDAAPILSAEALVTSATLQEADASTMVGTEGMALGGTSPKSASDAGAIASVDASTVAATTGVTDSTPVGSSESLSPAPSIPAPDVAPLASSEGFTIQAAIVLTDSTLLMALTGYLLSVGLSASDAATIAASEVASLNILRVLTSDDPSMLLSVEGIDLTEFLGKGYPDMSAGLTEAGLPTAPSSASVQPGRSSAPLD